MSKKYSPSSAGNDKSPIINQRDKINEELQIREFPWTNKQKELIHLIQDKRSKLILLSGPAGSSKSLVSMYCGLQFLNNKRVDEILYSRPILESADIGSKLGFLPGDREIKSQPYLQVVEDKLSELLPSHQIKRLKNDERIKFLEVNYARGLNIAAKYWIIDESQGFCEKELITLLTRIGHAAKVILCADPAQSDLPSNKRGAFQKLIQLFSDDLSKENGIFTFEFNKEDILRSSLCKFIVEKLENSDIGKNGH